MRPILIVGGYGAFGAHAAERLAQEPDLEIILAGRSEARAASAAGRLAQTAKARISHRVIDALAVAPGDLTRDGGVGVVINASGPFQEHGYRLAEAAIAAGVHYVDLADDRAFVTGIVGLDATARAKDVLAVSGASSVPGLSSAVIQELAPLFACMTSIDIGISPGASFDPGEATTASVLSGLGRPIEVRTSGRSRTVYGWQGLGNRNIRTLGRRFLGHVDVPDLELLPERYPDLESVSFQAGTEVAVMHLGMWALSWLVRARLLSHPERLARPLLSLKRRLNWLGSDRGGMFVDIGGFDAAGQPMGLEWTLVAGSGHGPYIPAAAAVILARKLARGEELRRGATPCLGLISLEEFLAEFRGLDVETQRVPRKTA